MMPSMSRATRSTLPSSSRPADPAQAAHTIRLAAWTRAGALVSACALVALCVAWESCLAPTGRGTLALKALPLLPAVAGLWRDRLYTYRWVSLLVWVYVAEGAIRVATDHGTARWLAAVELVLCAALFATCAAQVRLQLAIIRDRATARIGRAGQ